MVRFLSIMMILLGLVPVVEGYATNVMDTSPSGWLHAQGRLIEDAQGNVVRLNGANTYIRLQNERAKFENAKQYGFNTIRLMLFKSDIEHPTSEPNVDKSGLAAIDKAVGWCKEFGLQLILEHQIWAAGVEPAPGIFLSDATTQLQWLNMWRLLVDRYKDNPTVVGIDLMNEPYNLKNNGIPSSVTDPEGAWEQIAKNAITDLRTHNPNLLFIVEDFGLTVANGRWRDVNFLKQCNCVYSTHLYYYFHKTWNPWAQAYASGNLAKGRQLLGQWMDDNYVSYVNQGLPVWIGETGFVTSDPYWREEMNDELALFDERGLGYSIYTYAAWPWTEPFDMTNHAPSDYSPTIVGQIFSNHLLGLPSTTSTTTTTSATTSTTSSTTSSTGVTTATRVTTLQVMRRTTTTSTNTTTSTGS